MWIKILFHSPVCAREKYKQLNAKYIFFVIYFSKYLNAKSNIIHKFSGYLGTAISETLAELGADRSTHAIKHQQRSRPAKARLALHKADCTRSAEGEERRLAPQPHRQFYPGKAGGEGAKALPARE